MSQPNSVFTVGEFQSWGSNLQKEITIGGAEILFNINTITVIDIDHYSHQVSLAMKNSTFSSIETRLQAKACDSFQQIKDKCSTQEIDFKTQ